LDGDFRVGPWLVAPSLNNVSRNGTTVQLEPKVMSVLVCLAEHPGEPISKEKLLRTVWPDTFVGEGVLVRSIVELRRVFEDDAKEPRVIQTIAKRGYRLMAPVVPVNGTAYQVPGNGTLVTADRHTGSTSVQRNTRLGILVGLGMAVLLVVILGFSPSKWWQPLRGGTSRPEIRSLAVLPLQNLSGDPNQEYFSDGMTEELITELSRLSGLKVISRTSVMRYKKTDKTLPEIAHDLNVDAIVEGSVLRSGDQVRVSAQLIYAPQDTHLWAKTYDRDLRDALTLQATVANAIADEIKVKLTPKEEVQLAKTKVVDPKALDAYLTGRFHLSRKVGLDFVRGQEEADNEEQTKALHFFKEAIKGDPDYAPAYLGLADTLLSGYSWDAESVKRARTAVTRAIELDDSLADAHFTLAQIRVQFDWDWAGTEKELKRVIEINPNSAEGHANYGNLLDAMARFDEALKEYQKAQELDPGIDHLGEELYFRRNWDLERDLAVRQFGANGGDRSSWYRAVEYERLGMEREAIEEWARVAKLYGYDRVAETALRAYARSGYKAALHALVTALEKESGAEYMFPTFIAHFYGELNDRTRAFLWLEKCFQLHTGDLEFVKVDPFWSDNLRSDPRFADLVRRIGLPQ
jgi:TolB-like protein/DNA-binding winged helix-turn-helix (wHTH) protein